MNRRRFLGEEKKGPHYIFRDGQFFGGTIGRFGSLSGSELVPEEDGTTYRLNLNNNYDGTGKFDVSGFESLVIKGYKTDGHSGRNVTFGLARKTAPDAFDMNPKGEINSTEERYYRISIPQGTEPSYITFATAATDYRVTEIYFETR